MEKKSPFHKSSQPLLKDLASQQLCKIEAKNYGEMNRLFYGVADIDLIEEQWDQIMRVIASIKNGIAPAHVIINRLISRVRSDRLTQAITALVTPNSLAIKPTVLTKTQIICS